VHVRPKRGATFWVVERGASEILPPGTQCRKCGNGTFIKETDILDVWFDSGSAMRPCWKNARSCAGRPTLLRGSDQHRGGSQRAPDRRGLPAPGPLQGGPDPWVRGRTPTGARCPSPSATSWRQEVIDRYGAEILRLWVSASDYQDDVRISDNILSQLSDAYRRIRNTSRFLLGNLYDFNPEKDALPAAELQEIDRFMLHRLQLLIEKARRAYEGYEFHTIYHGLYNFCTVDLSALYLDILKDRLYSSPARSAARRSAQTVLFSVLDALARLMAPILPSPPRRSGSTCRPPTPSRRASTWRACAAPGGAAGRRPGRALEKLLRVRAEVTKALEDARVRKLIGHALDAAVTIAADAELYAELARMPRAALGLHRFQRRSPAGGRPGRGLPKRRDPGPVDPGPARSGRKVRALLGL